MKPSHVLHLREHRFIQGLVELLEHKLRSGQTEGLEAALTTLARRLRLHLEIEETRVFPAIEAKLGTHGFPPLATFRREHQVLRALLDTVLARAGGDPAAAAIDVSELGSALRLHAREEELILYPVLDRALGASACAQLEALMTEEA